MNERPKIKLALNFTDKLIEFSTWMLLVFSWAYCFYIYHQLPEKIATHYDMAGKADGFGHKSSLYWMLVVPTVMAIGLTILNRFPHIFNYPIEITADNAAVQYRLATRMLRVLKLVMVGIFGMIAWQSSQAAIAQQPDIGWWFLPITLLLVFAPLIYFLIQMSKHR